MEVLNLFLEFVFKIINSQHRNRNPVSNIQLRNGKVIEINGKIKTVYHIYRSSDCVVMTIVVLAL